MNDDFDTDEDFPFPLAVKIAGWIWMVIGGIAGLLIITSWFLWGVPIGAPMLCSYMVAMLAAILFVIGLVTVRGRILDIAVPGVASLVLAGIALMSAVSSGLPALNRPPAFLIGLLLTSGLFAVQGLLLLVAGVLALTGRRQYMTWREVNGPNELDDQSLNDTADPPANPTTEDPANAP